ncbi:hypothetical protein EV401DRAFT_1938849 [Pisolithus croceorrhizus]|nr:hypothetical protein EV401DRAFT_1938849 [Pisolithus croceorrhizus]
MGQVPRFRWISVKDSWRTSFVIVSLLFCGSGDLCVDRWPSTANRALVAQDRVRLVCCSLHWLGRALVRFLGFRSKGCNKR